MQMEPGAVCICLHTKQAIMHEHLKDLQKQQPNNGMGSSITVIDPANSVHTDADTQGV